MNTYMDEQHAFQRKLKKIFNDFRRCEKPFGEPKEEYSRYTMKARSKCYSLRNIPYRVSFEKMKDFVHQ